MGYTISEVSKRTGLSTSTIRYYDKEGLIPFIERKDSSYRVFHEDDLAMLEIIECLKKTGMSIKDIKQYSEWIKKGDDSLHERYEMFLDRKKAVEAQIAELNDSIRVINRKISYYEKAIEAGTEKIHYQHND